MRFVTTLPKSLTADVIGKQLLRCATSVGANYRAACRAKSTPDFIAKMTIVEEECDEAGYWMELIAESGLKAGQELTQLRNEADELVAITVASIRTAKQRQNTIRLAGSRQSA
jgi:four helix bundle protein